MVGVLITQVSRLGVSSSQFEIVTAVALSLKIFILLFRSSR